MAVTNGEAVSSNWKRLQEKIKLEGGPRKSETAPNTTKRIPILKRKRATGDRLARKDVATGSNNTLVSLQRGDNKRRRIMGNYLSSSQPATPRPVSNLTRDHDIAPADLVAAYGTTQRNANDALTSPTDDINGGLHPRHKIGKFVALDCEMVGTGPPPDYPDNLLARVSVVNFHGEQIYDSYVQPPPGVTVEDYRTAYSGIRAEHLAPETARPLLAVQKEIADILDGRILVGHALRNDLAVLMLPHPKRDVRDTARHAKYRVASKGKAPALRNLAKDELGLTIQTGEHSSLEDARVTMMLFRKEKRVFEEDNRRQFGQPRKVKGAAGRRQERSMTPLSADEEEDEEDDEDDLLEGEDDGVTLAGSGASKGKKRKKKKRTKRK